MPFNFHTDSPVQRLFQHHSVKISLAPSHRIRYWTRPFLDKNKPLRISPLWGAETERNVISTKTYDYKTFEPQETGLFCQRIFGPLNDKSQRRSRLGYILLATPVMHIWFLKGSLSYAALLTNQKRKYLEGLVYCNQYTMPTYYTFEGRAHDPELMLYHKNIELMVRDVHYTQTKLNTHSGVYFSSLLAIGYPRRYFNRCATNQNLNQTLFNLPASLSVRKKSTKPSARVRRKNAIRRRKMRLLKKKAATKAAAAEIKGTVGDKKNTRSATKTQSSTKKVKSLAASNKVNKQVGKTVAAKAKRKQNKSNLKVKRKGKKRKKKPIIPSKTINMLQTRVCGHRGLYVKRRKKMLQTDLDRCLDVKMPLNEKHRVWLRRKPKVMKQINIRPVINWRKVPRPSIFERSDPRETLPAFTNHVEISSSCNPEVLQPLNPNKPPALSQCMTRDRIRQGYITVNKSWVQFFLNPSKNQLQPEKLYKNFFDKGTIYANDFPSMLISHKKLKAFFLKQKVVDHAEMEKILVRNFAIFQCSAMQRFGLTMDVVSKSTYDVFERHNFESCLTQFDFKDHTHFISPFLTLAYELADHQYNKSHQLLKHCQQFENKTSINFSEKKAYPKLNTVIKNHVYKPTESFYWKKLASPPLEAFFYPPPHLSKSGNRPPHLSKRGRGGTPPPYLSKRGEGWRQRDQSIVNFALPSWGKKKTAPGLQKAFPLKTGVKPFPLLPPPPFGGGRGELEQGEDNPGSNMLFFSALRLKSYYLSFSPLIKTHNNKKPILTYTFQQNLNDVGLYKTHHMAIYMVRNRFYTWVGNLVENVLYNLKKINRFGHCQWFLELQKRFMAQACYWPLTLRQFYFQGTHWSGEVGHAGSNYFGFFKWQHLVSNRVEKTIGVETRQTVTWQFFTNGKRRKKYGRFFPNTVFSKYKPIGARVLVPYKVTGIRWKGSRVTRIETLNHPLHSHQWAQRMQTRFSVSLKKHRLLSLIKQSRNNMFKEHLRAQMSHRVCSAEFMDYEKQKIIYCFLNQFHPKGQTLFLVTSKSKTKKVTKGRKTKKGSRKQPKKSKSLYTAESFSWWPAFRQKQLNFLKTLINFSCVETLCWLLEMRPIDRDLEKPWVFFPTHLYHNYCGNKLFSVNVNPFHQVYLNENLEGLRYDFNPGFIFSSVQKLKKTNIKRKKLFTPSLVRACLQNYNLTNVACFFKGVWCKVMQCDTLVCPQHVDKITHKNIQKSNLITQLQSFLLRNPQLIRNRYGVVPPLFTLEDATMYGDFLEYLCDSVLYQLTQQVIPAYAGLALMVTTSPTSSDAIQLHLKQYYPKKIKSHWLKGSTTSPCLQKLKDMKGQIQYLNQYLRRPRFWLARSAWIPYPYVYSYFRNVDPWEVSSEYCGFDRTRRMGRDVERKETRRARLIRQYKVISPFRHDVHPAWLTVNLLPILPPDLRPMMVINDALMMSDLNNFYRKVVDRRNKVRRYCAMLLVEANLPIGPRTKLPKDMLDWYPKYVFPHFSFRIGFAETPFYQRLQQEAVDSLIENGKGAPLETSTNGRPLKSLSDILKGKKGRFRQNLLGKRVDYSGRSVIVVGPQLKLHQCGLPREMAFVLFHTYLVRALVDAKVTPSFGVAKRLIDRKHPAACRQLERLVEDRLILLNRAPTLHRLGFQAFQAKLVSGRAILLHPLVCSAFNADFDGDQMAVHIPLTKNACAEAVKLMWGRNQLLSAASGEPSLLPSQDMVLGCYYLTSWDNLQRWQQLKQMVDTKTHALKKAWQGSTVDANLGTKLTELTFSHISQVQYLFSVEKIELHRVIWLKSNTAFEFQRTKQVCFELQISSSGLAVHLHPDFKTYQYNLYTLPTHYIKTTVGRALMNQALFDSFSN